MRSIILTTPLRYPGGKSKWTKLLYEYLPNMGEYKEWREPFLGGGSMSIEITKKFPDMKIWVNDLYPALFILTPSKPLILLNILSWTSSGKEVDIPFG